MVFYRRFRVPEGPKDSGLDRVERVGLVERVVQGVGAHPAAGNILQSITLGGHAGRLGLKTGGQPCTKPGWLLPTM